MKYLFVETWTKSGKKGYDVIAINHNLGVLDIMDFQYTMDAHDLLSIIKENFETYTLHGSCVMRIVTNNIKGGRYKVKYV
nr:MAG TPA: hypothetical protein [Caudoviricetes sp.]